MTPRTATKATAQPARRVRRAKKKAVERGAPVVERVLTAALRELARVGYAALTIDEVATAAGVNKTTVYRRWPTRSDLVIAALRSVTESGLSFESTGDVRADLVAMARQSVALLSSPEGISIARTLVAEGADPELRALARSIRKQQERAAFAVVEAAKARGELDPELPPEVLLGSVFGAILHRRLLMHEPVDDAFVERVVDLALRGGLTARARRTGSA